MPSFTGRVSERCLAILSVALLLPADVNAQEDMTLLAAGDAVVRAPLGDSEIVIRTTSRLAWRACSSCPGEIAISADLASQLVSTAPPSPAARPVP